MDDSFDIFLNSFFVRDQPQRKHLCTRGCSSQYWNCLCLIFHTLLYPNTKGNKRLFFFSMIQRTTQTVNCFNTLTHQVISIKAATPHVSSYYKRRSRSTLAYQDGNRLTFWGLQVFEYFIEYSCIYVHGWDWSIILFLVWVLCGFSIQGTCSL